MREQCVIALGFFDGVHLGHGILLDAARNRARELGCRAVALTYDVHPAEVLCGRKVPLLTTAEARVRLMKERYGMDAVEVLPFDRSLADTDWEQFVEEVLAERFRACHVVCGFDHRFGKGGQGTPDRLREKCAALGIGCFIAPPLSLDGTVISSTRIRELLEQGDVNAANRCLGHPYTLTGTVIRGKQLGRQLGFPTANLTAAPELALPGWGVYAAKVTLADGSVRRAVTNVGLRPTVEDGLGLLIESWLPGFDGDLYGQEISVAFYGRLRGERKFGTLEELRQEIFRNADQMEALFRENA